MRLIAGTGILVLMLGCAGGCGGGKEVGAKPVVSVGEEVDPKLVRNSGEEAQSQLGGDGSGLGEGENGEVQAGASDQKKVPSLPVEFSFPVEVNPIEVSDYTESMKKSLGDKIEYSCVWTWEKKYSMGRDSMSESDRESFDDLKSRFLQAVKEGVEKAGGKVEIKQGSMGGLKSIEWKDPNPEYPRTNHWWVRANTLDQGMLDGNATLSLYLARNKMAD